MTAMVKATDAVTHSRRETHWRLWLLMSALIVTVVLGGTPALVQYHLWAGRSCLAEQQAEAALKHFLKAQGLNPTNAETQFWLARAYRKTGDLQGLQRSLEKARQFGYRDSERLRREWYLVLAETGRLTEVEGRLSEMMMHPGDDGPEICSAFTKGYCLNLKFQEAHAILDAWQADFPDDDRPYLERGRIFAGNERWKEAEGAFREALARDPKKSAAHRGIAEALIQLGNPGEAEKSLRLALSLSSSDPQTRLLLAQLRYDRKDFADAEAIIRPVTDGDRENIAAMVLSAKCLAANGHMDEAVTRLSSAVERWPEDFSARYALAQTLRSAGRGAEAESHFKTYTQLQRDAPRLEELKKEVRQQPESSDVRYELGVLMLKHISRPEGVAWLESALRLKPDHAGARLALAEYFDKVGNRDLAERHRQAIQLQPVTSILESSKPEGPTP